MSIILMILEYDIQYITIHWGDEVLQVDVVPIILTKTWSLSS